MGDLGVEMQDTDNVSTFKCLSFIKEEEQSI